MSSGTLTKRVVTFALFASIAAAASPSLSAQQLPPLEADAVARLNDSPRHGEWVTVPVGNDDQVVSWVVYPERADRAPVVVVIQEIFGLTDWIRSVTDQLAAEGFIAIAPDLLTGKGPNGGNSDSVDQQGATALVRQLDPDQVQRRLRAAGEYATALPAASGSVASIGFCWGGDTSFAFATTWPELDAAVVYYGRAPSSQALASLRAPVLGLYGGDDARVDATIEPARDVIEGLGGRYEVHIFDGAGHGFLRQQDGRDGANLRASEEAWPRTIAFLKEELER